MRIAVNNITSSRFIIFSLLTLSGLLFVIATVGALKAAPTPNITVATFSTNRSTLLAGQVVSYTLVINNQGEDSAEIDLTTALPAEMAYQTSTFSAETNQGVIETVRQVDPNSLAWQGQLAEGKTVTLTVSATVSQTVSSNITLTHSAIITDQQATVELTTPTYLLGAPVSTLFVPLLSTPRPIPQIHATQPQPVDDLYTWTVDWDIPAYAMIGRFTLEESHDPTFETGITAYVTRARERTITKAAGTNNVFYYRIRPHGDGMQSAVVKVISAYRDDFSAETTWQLRREDFDDTNNQLSYVGNQLNLWVHGRWDYMIASPLTPAPAPPYRIETRVKFAGPASRNTYGIIFGSDWNGATCQPSKIATDASNCLNHYYRAMMLWYTGEDRMKMSLKRIDSHNHKNSGVGGNTLQGWTGVDLSASANDWNTWQIEVYPDGTIKLFSDGNLLSQSNDPTFIDHPYWGLWASTDISLGSDPLFDYVLVEPIATLTQKDE